jgi:L-asparaginase
MTTNGRSVAFFALGGTIASQPGQSPGLMPTLSADGLVAAVPSLMDVARLEVLQFRQLPGPHLGFGDIEALAAAIRASILKGAGGVVVAQGTDTIEETAFILDRILDVDAPVVVTGAMRGPSLPSADGPANLLGAVRVAASKEARHLGTLVAFNDEIHAARLVTKSDTSKPSAFCSPSAGPIGFVVEDRVRFTSRVDRVASLPLSDQPSDARVALIRLGFDDDGLLIDLAADAGYQGIVIEALGGGHVPAVCVDRIARAARTMPVVLASRTGAGEVLRGTYGFPGAEIDLQQRGAIRSGWLDGIKSRILLSLVLRHRAGNAADHFEPWGGGR